MTPKDSGTSTPQILPDNEVQSSLSIIDASIDTQTLNVMFSDRSSSSASSIVLNF